jgi:hypothetical protein
MDVDDVKMMSGYCPSANPFSHLFTRKNSNWVQLGPIPGVDESSGLKAYSPGGHRSDKSTGVKRKRHGWPADPLYDVLEALSKNWEIVRVCNIHHNPIRLTI